MISNARRILDRANLSIELSILRFVSTKEVVQGFKSDFFESEDQAKALFAIVRA